MVEWAVSLELISTKEAVPFYKKKGFEERPCEWDGPGMFKMIRWEVQLWIFWRYKFLFYWPKYIPWYILNIRKGLIIMMTAKVFENGRSQAVRLPKECRFNTDEVAVNRIGDIVLLMPKTNKWSSFMQAIDMFSDDFMKDGRDGRLEQERDELWDIC